MKQIPLTQGKVALVDDEDYAGLIQFKWHAYYCAKSKTFYAKRNIGQKRNGGQRTEYMSRRILNAKSGERVDHTNHNGLDNQRHNIRICTPSQNGANMEKRDGKSSRFKGVCWNKGKQKWEASIRLNRKGIYLGAFSDDRIAAEAYDKAARKNFGEFALTNFPLKGNQVALQN